MKMIKRLKVILFAPLFILLLTACSIKPSSASYFKKIEIGMNKKSVENIIKVTGDRSKNDNNKYYYDIKNDKRITIEYKNNKVSTVSIDYDKNELKNKKVNLSNLDVLRKKVKTGITYDELKKQIGGKDGFMYEKNKNIVNYIWVSESGGFVRAAFKIDDNKCVFFNGYKN